MKFLKKCAWCQDLISENEYPETKYSPILQMDGVITSHGICERCKPREKKSYTLQSNKSQAVHSKINYFI